MEHLVTSKELSCTACGDSYDDVYALANCEKVCDKCFKHETYCQDCENKYLED